MCTYMLAQPGLILPVGSGQLDLDQFSVYLLLLSISCFGLALDRFFHPQYGVSFCRPVRVAAAAIVCCGAEAVCGWSLH